MDNYSNQPPKGMRLAFGIFMVLIYLAVGILFIVNVFDIANHTISIVIGALLCAYGVFRGYRMYKGMN
ncbi:MAG: hypothetical protein K2L83_03025 [Muribaculaceae bacterium]|nr:hypothetical protein [Muribaculaceae bacterium]MDE6329665.1 hypothetical protein [Muribaculaceae bacterium]